MDKSVIIVAVLVTADVVVILACCLLRKKQAKIDKDLTDVLLANREAIIKRNKLLVKEVEYLKSIIDLVTKKKNQEEGEKQDGKEESESQL